MTSTRLAKVYLLVRHMMLVIRPDCTTSTSLGLSVATTSHGIVCFVHITESADNYHTVLHLHLQATDPPHDSSTRTR